MRRTCGCLAALVAVCLGWSAGAQAAGTFVLCSTGKGRAIVLPGKSGKCARHQHAIALASAAALSAAEHKVSSQQSEIGSLHTDLTSKQNAIATLEGQVKGLSNTLAGVTRQGNTLRFTGMNLQILSGSGATNGPVNGLGNLIIGYDEHPGTQSGSHNLVLGDRQTFTSYGGVIAGRGNTVSGPFGDAFGADNTASGESSSVTGGEQNAAQGNQSSVLGGELNLASDAFSSVVSGCENLAGSGSPMSGSCATSGAEAVLGGFENTASGLEATVSGGEVGSASGGAASVAGGQFNVAGGGGSAVAGGDDNSASGTFASILGGFSNFATTFDASVSGGESNTASGTGSSVLGGEGNTASGNCQAIPAAPGSC